MKSFRNPTQGFRGIEVVGESSAGGDGGEGPSAIPEVGEGFEVDGLDEAEVAAMLAAMAEEAGAGGGESVVDEEPLTEADRAFLEGALCVCVCGVLPIPKGRCM